MSGGPRDFNNIEMQAVINFLFPARQGAEGNSRHPVINIRGTCNILCHHQNWVAQIKRGDFSTCDGPHPALHKIMVTPDIIEQIYELILEDHQISAKSVAEQLVIWRERVVSIIHEDLDMQKLSEKWILKHLKTDKKYQCCQASEQLLEFFRRVPNDFLSGVIGDNVRNLVISLSPETKQQSME